VGIDFSCNFIFGYIIHPPIKIFLVLPPKPNTKPPLKILAGALCLAYSRGFMLEREAEDQAVV
jgi:hypothetical protein